MTKQERVKAVFAFKEPDLVPIDFGATNNSGIALHAYKDLIHYMDLNDQTIRASDMIQQLAEPSEELLLRFETEFRGGLPKYYATIPLPVESANWKAAHIKKNGILQYQDEWDVVYRFDPKHDFYYSRISGPLEGTTVEIDDIRHLSMPSGDESWRFPEVEQKMVTYRKTGNVTVLRSVCSGLVEMASKLRGMDNFLVDAMMTPKTAEYLLHRIFDVKMRFWDAVLDKMGTSLDIAVEADDYGTQESLLISPLLFKKLLKPLWSELFSYIKRKAPHIKILFHSCGAVRALIPDFIEMGADALNPIHITARGMEPEGLKHDFGKEIVFWGGGIDTQRVLPMGTAQEIQDDVKRNFDALAPGGGWVFAPVHNIQADVSPKRILMMMNTFRQLREK